MNTICIMCPMGCPIEITETNGEITVSGNTCKRGEVYGKAEFVSPVRMVTSSVKYRGGVTSVKTSDPVKKELIFDVLKEIKKISIESELRCGDVIAKNIANSGADLVVTGNL